MSECDFYFSIRCSKCHTNANAYGFVSIYLSHDGEFKIIHDDREKAAEAWNKRV
jgi:hypothetical protein